MQTDLDNPQQNQNPKATSNHRMEIFAVREPFSTEQKHIDGGDDEKNNHLTHKRKEGATRGEKCCNLRCF